MTPEERADRLVHEAEAAKAKTYVTPGKNDKQFHSVMVDDDYLLVAAHVDNATLTKIINSEYVDFSKTGSARPYFTGRRSAHGNGVARQKDLLGAS